MRVALAAALGFTFSCVPLAVAACTPPPDFHERRQEYEDEQLLRATVMFRGVIEDFQAPDGQYGDTTMVIRQTEAIWGHGAPSRVVIPREYFSNCARGNLHAAVDMWGEFPGLPRVRNGLGVTLLGRQKDESAPWDFIILVDNAPDTQRVLRRFRELKQGQ